MTLYNNFSHYQLYVLFLLQQSSTCRCIKNNYESHPCCLANYREFQSTSDIAKAFITSEFLTV